MEFTWPLSLPDQAVAAAAAADHLSGSQWNEIAFWFAKSAAKVAANKAAAAAAAATVANINQSNWSRKSNPESCLAGRASGRLIYLAPPIVGGQIISWHSLCMFEMVENYLTLTRLIISRLSKELSRGRANIGDGCEQKLGRVLLRCNSDQWTPLLPLNSPGHSKRVAEATSVQARDHQKSASGCLWGVLQPSIDRLLLSLAQHCGRAEET